jgi:hypothetical protein
MTERETKAKLDERDMLKSKSCFSFTFDIDIVCPY